MKKTIKQIISIVLCAVMIMTAVPFSGLLGLDLGISASAYCSTVSEISAKLAEIEKENAFKSGANKGENYSCWYLSNDVSKKLFGVGIDEQKSSYMAWYENNYRAIAPTVSNASTDSVISLIKQAQPGDVLQYKHYYYSYGVKCTGFHTCTVKSISSTSVTIIEATRPYKKNDNYNYYVRQRTISLTDKSNFESWNGFGLYNGSSYGMTIYRYKNLKSESSVASMPTISTSNYPGGVKVSLSSATSGATIYYTTNGSTPTVSSTKYSGAFNLTSSATVKAIAVKSGMTTSGIASKAVTVNKTSTPKISSSLTSSAFNIKITGESGATIYYTTDGSTPTTSSNRYNGQFSLTSTATIKAIAVKSGKAYSSVATSSISAKIPNTPVVKLESPSSGVCGIGDEMRISWSPVPNAAYYEITIKNGGMTLTDIIFQGCTFSYVLNEAGEHTVSVKAVNFLGKSKASSPEIEVNVKPNVTVKFADHDGTVISEQSVKYGGNAVAPAAPSRTGYTFTSWKGSYSTVKADTTVTATYSPNTYTVKFVDSDGSSLGSEVVEYQKGVKNVPTVPSKTGYKFVAWSVKSGEGDSYEKVNGDVVFEPTYAWSNPDMPLAITAKKAIRSSDATSYTITVNVANSQSKVINGKLIAVIKTQNDKVVATKIDVISVPSKASNYSQTIIVGGTDAGSVAEVYIVANDSENDNRTGGAYSEKSSVAVTQESTGTSTYWGSWSSWSTTKTTASSTKEVKSKTQYRYRDKQTTTSTKSSLSGWTANGSYVTYGSWGSWSGWSTTKQTESSTKDVETRTVYKFQHYCSSSGTAPNYNYPSGHGKDGPHVYYSTYKPTLTKSSTTNYYYTKGVFPGCSVRGNTRYYYMGEVTQYRYRTRTATTNYNYYKWGDWSDWSDTAYSKSSTRDVGTRTVYRYRDLLTKTTTSSTAYIGAEDTTGTVYNISGKLENVTGDYSGKVAIIMVYKDKNIDPTEDQMQYVGQTTIGSGNSYNFSFIPKDAISAETGNYIISFGIATADGLVNNVEIIEAPKPSYNVVFKDNNGNILKQQSVVSGEDAVPPEISEQNGYELTWNRSFTDITRDTEITLISTPKTYNVIFVDWANDEVVDIKEAEYGSQIAFPEDCSAEGKTFIGWSVPEGSIVTETMVVEAVYEDLMFTVNFLNHDGTVYEDHMVPYGATASFPEENPVADGYEFVTWSNDAEWWNVTEDITISPVFIFDQTVEAPMSNAVDGVQLGFANVDFETSTEDATIRYTTDGTEPTEESVVFDDTIWIEETTTFKVKAFKAGMNASATVETTFEVIPEAEYDSKLPKVTAVTSGSYYTVGSDSAKLCMRIDNPSGFTINSWGYLVENLSTNETSDYINTEISGMTDVTVGRVFNISGLTASTDYSYTFYVEFEEIGLYESETYSFTTLSEGEGTGSDITIPSISIKNPSTTTINYKSGIVLHANVTNMPDGGKIVWTADNSNFKVTDNGDGTCTIISDKTGDTNFTATVVDSNRSAINDANGNPVQAEVKMYSNAGFFQKIIAFFKGLFGGNKVLPQMLGFVIR